MPFRSLFLPAAVVAIALAAGCAAVSTVPPVPVDTLASPSPLAPSPVASSNWISTPPTWGPKVQTQFTARGDGNRLGVVATWELVAGLRHFKASHEGKYNFIVSLRARGDARPGSILAFNRVGRGSWSYSEVVERTGDYFVEVSGGGPWDVMVE